MSSASAMEGVCAREESDSLTPEIFQIPGEWAVLINGVPNVPPSPIIPANSNNALEMEEPRPTGFGAWLEGREVKKQFGDQYYAGTVTEYDKESGWYQVVYEDGDFEDLEWHELRDILEPLDVSTPPRNLALKNLALKNLALKIIRKNEKPDLPIVVKDVSSSASAHKTKPAKSIRGPRKNKHVFDSRATVVFALRAALRGKHVFDSRVTGIFALQAALRRKHVFDSPVTVVFALRAALRR